MLQGFLKGEHVVMADTGDCIFWTQKLRLPYGAGYACAVVIASHTSPFTALSSIRNSGAKSQTSRICGLVSLLLRIVLNRKPINQWASAAHAACRFQAQMQYGSIGWSVGACLGCAVGSRAQGRRMVLFVGDGCFQIGAQVQCWSFVAR